MRATVGGAEEGRSRPSLKSRCRHVSCEEDKQGRRRQGVSGKKGAAVWRRGGVG
jgi:hypothetical protein